MLNSVFINFYCVLENKTLKAFPTWFKIKIATKTKPKFIILTWYLPPFWVWAGWKKLKKKKNKQTKKTKTPTNDLHFTVPFIYV